MAEKKAVGHAYNVDFLNVVFAVSSVLLFVSVVWMVWDDYDREWKNYQRRFVQLEMQVTEARIEQAGRAIDRRALEALEARRAGAEEQVRANESTIADLRRQIDRLNARLYAVSQRFQFAKATYDVDRYAYEVRLKRNPALRETEGRAILARAAALEELQVEEEQLTAERDALQEELGKYTGELAELDGEIDELTAEERRLRTRLNVIAPSLTKRFFRDAPLLDFMAPTITVRQVITPNIVEDVNFMVVPKMDRCMTCHLAIDTPGFEEYPQPFATHPSLDAYVGSSSPHPMQEIGCTVCHEGMGQSISFVDAAHTPRTLEQQAEWERNYNWESLHFWDFPMLPSGMAEASCAKCHQGETYLPEGPTLTLAYGLYERAGCYACHRTKGFENLRKPGPDLTRIEAKLTPDWVRTWLRRPTAIKPSTWMPQPWYNSNSSGPDDARRNEAEIEATVAYLFANSEPHPLAVASPPRGNAEAGQTIVEAVGCLACHVTGDESRMEAGPRRTFGQPLQNIGNKTTYEWLFDWVRDPDHYSPGTYMPDLRLTDREVADVAAYLMTLRGPAGEAAPVAFEQAAADEVLRDYLRSIMPIAQAEARLAALTPEERMQELGRRAIGRYGCFSCHDIKGFEDEQPIGTDLSEQGTKPLSQLDFAFADIPHTKLAWFEHKILDPRSFDHGRVLQPLEKLRMPDFHASEEEARLFVTALMSFQKEVQPTQARRPGSARSDLIVAGRNLVQRRNCVACHVIEGNGGDYEQLVADPSLAPPLLTPQGAKVQHDWTYAFVQDPITIRPWLDVRMPSFDLEDAEWNQIISYFAAVADSIGPFRRPALVRATAGGVVVGRQVVYPPRCQQCHVLGTIPADQPTANLAPDLRMSAERLQPDWILDWLRDPMAIQPGTRMPAFWPNHPESFYEQLGGDAEAQIRAVRDHLLRLRGGPSPSRPAAGAIVVADP
jgi:mono/diheme cytochrome c family protein/predicted  nucleic acid-binding Zn-ribbon protein